MFVWGSDCVMLPPHSRVIQIVLRGLTLKDTIAYLDGVNVLGKSFEEHLNNLDAVLERFSRYNLKLKPRKCFIFQTECEFLGKRITREGASISPAK
jgi:phosphoribosyl-dephospho-CoA transferase